MATLVGVKKFVLRIALLKVRNDSRICASCVLDAVFLILERSSSSERTAAVLRRAYESVGLFDLVSDVRAQEGRWTHMIWLGV